MSFFTSNRLLESLTTGIGHLLGYRRGGEAPREQGMVSIISKQQAAGATCCQKGVETLLEDRYTGGNDLHSLLIDISPAPLVFFFYAWSSLRKLAELLIPPIKVNTDPSFRFIFTVLLFCLLSALLRKTGQGRHGHGEIT